MAKRYSPSSPQLVVFLLISAASLAIALLYRFRPSAITSITGEDGPVEMASAIFYFFAFMLFAYKAIKADRLNVFLWGLAILFFLVAGEEASWGQRMFGLETPESLREENVQSELNFHNLDFIHGSVRAISLLVVWGIFVLCPAVSRLRLFTGFASRWRIPIADIWTGVLVVAGTMFMAIPRLSGKVVFALDEIGEFYFSVAALGFGISAAADVFRDPKVTSLEVTSDRSFDHTH